MGQETKSLLQKEQHLLVEELNAEALQVKGMHCRDCLGQ